MKDIVLQGFVNSFAEDREYTSQEESTLFEAFASSAILRKLHHTDDSELDDFLIGGNGDGGIDAIAILVNGRPARTKEDVDYFIEKLRRLDVEFIFIQAKTSSGFKAENIGTFVHGVNQFFSQDPDIPFRQEIEEIRQLKNYVYQKSINMESNPKCHLYYVAAGSWNNDLHPKAMLEKGKRELTELNLFSLVESIPVDAERLKTIYRELERGSVKDVEFSKVAVFPRIDGVQEAYLGLLAGSEFIKLVTTTEGDLNRNLFYDNVRDFQGHNPVNKDIKQTITDSETIGRFPLLNNGVTIVARSINRTGDIFKLSDFQIVNGCQTAHVLYQNRDKIMDSTAFVPVKLVVTNESDVITEVIKATNRQTPVLPEALESLTPFHKELEDFYNVQQANSKKENRIYYERRSKQFAFDRIKPSNIVTLTTQTKSFVAMFLNEPHSHHRYYGELLKAYESRLFVHEHKPIAYYASGYACLAVERLFNSGLLAREMKQWKYHILMLLRIQIGGATIPQFNSNDINLYASKVVEGLVAEDICKINCDLAIQTIQRALHNSKNPSGVHPSRLRAFTQQLEALVIPSGRQQEPKKHEPKVGMEEKGEMLWFDEWKNYGFIKRDLGGEIFVHTGGISGVPWQLCKPGMRVVYQVGIGRRGVLAENVRSDEIQ